MSDDMIVDDQDVDSGHDEGQEVQSQSQDQLPGQPQQPAQQQAQQPSPWEAFKRLPQFQGMDDGRIASNLVQVMQREQAATQRLAQMQQILPYAQEFLANQRDYNAWKQQRSTGLPHASPQVQQAQQLQQQPQQQGWWNPPKVRDSDMRYMVRDENGREVISPDAPLDVRRSLEELQAYKADFAKNFLSDPEKALGPMVEGRAKEIASQIVEQQLARRDNESFVDSIQQTNQDWLFDQETGNVTPEGFLVHKYIEEAKGLGIQDPKQRWDYAVRNTERDVLIRHFDEQQAYAAQQQQAAYQPQQPVAPEPPPPAPQQPQDTAADLARQNMEYLRREASRSPSRSAGTANSDPRAPKSKQSFEQMLMSDMADRGLI